MRITYAAAISRDGFIAREDGDVGWLDDFTVDPRASGLEALFADVDGLVMGRQTYDFIFDYGTWPYRDKLSWVCTHRPLQPLAGANLIVADDIDQVIESAAARRFSHLWLLGGAQLASAFLAKRLLTHVSLTELPIDLQQGIPLFAEHSLDQLPCRERTEMERAGFRQIELTLDPAV